MSQPLYFLPGLRAASADNIALRKGVLKERGLLDVFADVPFDHQPLWDLPARGPGDLAGALLCYQTPKGDMPTNQGYFPDQQKWSPVGDGSLLWIGFDPADPPKPEEMARRKQYPGYAVNLGEETWSVPVVRRPDGSTELPCDMLWDATGKLQEPIKPAYESYWNESAEVARWFFEGEQPTRERALELAVKSLGINYRFGRNEQNAFRTIDREGLFLVLAATVDAPSQNGAPKKTLAQSAEPGSPESSPATAPHEATSI